MDIEEVLSLISEGEGQSSEFKRTFAEQNEAIESLCAFTHANGGTVFFGVDDDTTIVGLSIGKNTLENFANELRRHTSPPLTPLIQQFSHDGLVIVAATIPIANPDQLFYAFNVPYIRVGKTNQVMSPDAQRARLQSTNDKSTNDNWSEEKDRPRFDVPYRSLTRTESAFKPNWALRQVSGDYVPTIEWRYRGARLNPSMDWRQVSGANLKNYTCSATFDLSLPVNEDELVSDDEIGLELQFHWHGRLRHEMHKFLLTKSGNQTKALWDVGREILPPLYLDE